MNLTGSYAGHIQLMANQLQWPLRRLRRPEPDSTASCAKPRPPTSPNPASLRVAIATADIGELSRRISRPPIVVAVKFAVDRSNGRADRIPRLDWRHASLWLIVPPAFGDISAAAVSECLSYSQDSSAMKACMPECGAPLCGFSRDRLAPGRPRQSADRAKHCRNGCYLFRVAGSFRTRQIRRS